MPSGASRLQSLMSSLEAAPRDLAPDTSVRKGKMISMSIENLTIAEARSIAQMFGGGVSAALPQPAQVPAAPAAERAVLVTTEHRGVFFGYATDTAGGTISLRAARNCLYWPAETKGFLGLASDGPGKGARIGPPADIELRGITCVAAVSPEAVKAWEAAPWKS